MNETKIETIQRHSRVAFMAVVTATMLVLTFHQARRGLSALPTAAVYALTVGFGLEFLTATWAGDADGRTRAEHSRL
jgi:hypothetical protein